MQHTRRLRGRFWIEAGVGLVSAFLAVLTAVRRDWIELVFNVDPDNHSGLLELALVGGAAVAFGLVAAAGMEVRRARRQRKEVASNG